VPALALQHLQVDAVVTEHVAQLGEQHLHEVGLGGAARQRANEPALQTRTRSAQAPLRDRRRAACTALPGTHLRLRILPKAVPFPSPKPLHPPPRELLGTTVLVVDDERVWRVILETDLRLLGYRVSMAQDAAEALQRAREDRPDVAIVDLMLPEP